MSVKSQSIQSKKQSGHDERLKISPLRVLLNRPELGALGGSILVFIFFGVVAGDTGMFSAYGTLNFLRCLSQFRNYCNSCRNVNDWW